MCSHQCFHSWTIGVCYDYFSLTTQHLPICLVFPHCWLLNVFITNSTPDFSQIYETLISDLKTVGNLLISSFWRTFYQSLLHHFNLDWLLSRFAVQVSSLFLPSHFSLANFRFHSARSPFALLCRVPYVLPLSWTNP